MLCDELVIAWAAVASIIPRQTEQPQDEQEAKHPCSGIQKLWDHLARGRYSPFVKDFRPDHGHTHDHSTAHADDHTLHNEACAAYVRAMGTKQS